MRLQEIVREITLGCNSFQLAPFFCSFQTFFRTFCDNFKMPSTSHGKLLGLWVTLCVKSPSSLLCKSMNTDNLRFLTFQGSALIGRRDNRTKRLWSDDRQFQESLPLFTFSPLGDMVSMGTTKSKVKRSKNVCGRK